MRWIFTLLALMLISSGMQAQTMLYSENFETTSLPDSVVYTGNGVHGKSSMLFSQGLRSDSMRIVVSGDSVVMTTQAFSTTGNSFVMLHFDQICKIEWNDEAYIEVSNNNGTTWTRLTGSQYQGASQFGTQGNKFSSMSYLDWVPTTIATPTNAWWKSETFDISLLVSNAANVKIRFILRDAMPGSTFGDNYAWFMDNIRVLGAYSELIPPVLTMLPPIVQDTVYSTGPYVVRAHITDQSLVDTAYLVYWVNVGTPDTIGMTRLLADTFSASIPFFGFGKNIHYYVVAVDGSAAHNTTTSNTYHFYCKFSIGGTYTIGTGTGLNTNTTYPAPYGNWYWGAKHQFLILGSELLALGAPGGNIGSVAFNVQTVQGTPLQGFTIKMGHTTQSALTATFVTNMTTVYTTASYTEVAGWNTHTFQTPFTWDGTSNVVVEVCFNNSSYTYNAVVYNSTTPFVSCTYYNTDAAGVCAQTSGPTSNSRPNMKLEILGVGSLTLDAGVGQIVYPTGGVVANTAFDVKVKVKNYGNDTLTAATVNWRLDGVLQSPYSWTGTLLKDSSSTDIILGNITLANGYHTIVAWTDNPNGQPDLNTGNDSSKISFMACASLLSGNYTIGGTGADFPTFSAAVTALDQCGISGPVVFNVAPGTYNEQISIPWVSGSSAINTITFKSATPDSTLVTLTYAATGASNNYLVQLSGSERVIFKNIKFVPTGTSYATAIKLTNGAKFNTITGNLFVGVAGTTDDLILIRVDGATNTDNLVKGNRLENGSIGMYFKGQTTANKLQNIVVADNVLEGFSSAGIKLEFVQATTVEANQMISAVTNSGTKNGIQVLYGQDTIKLIRNQIVLSNSTNTNGIYLENCTSAVGMEGMIANNFITILNGANLTYGMRILTSTRWNIFYNSLNITGTTNNDTRGVNTTAACSYIQVMNNNIQSNKYPTFYEGSSCSRSNFNNLYSTGNLYGYYVTSYMNFTSLAAYKASAQKDSASLSVPPFYTSTTDLHTSNGLLNGSATPVVNVLNDIDNELRNLLIPDIGADEFVPSSYDAAVLTIASPVTGCGKTATEPVTMLIKNVGAVPITNGLNANLRFNGSTTVITEPVVATINPGDTFYYTFAATVNMDVTAFATDSVFEIQVWTTLTGDNVQQNDTVKVWPESYYTPVPPVATNTSVLYGHTASLTATSNDTLFWYTTDTATVEVFMGQPYVTPPLFDTTTFYVAAGVFSAGLGTVGTGTLQNSTYGYPTPYGNYYWGAKHQMLVKASELITMGFKKGNIKALAFDVAAVNSCPALVNFEIKVGNTSLNDLTTNWESGLTSVYLNPSYQPVNGWNTHTFTTQFYWDGVSNIIIETCFNNSSYVSSGNATVNQTATAHISTHYVYNDAATVCSAPNAGSVISQRPNMKLTIESAGCKSNKVPLTVYVTGFPTEDAGVNAIINPPASTPSGTPTEIKVQIKNYGLSNLTSAKIVWSLNNQLQDSINWTGNLAKDSTTIVTIDTVTFGGGAYCMKAWTSMPNNVPDTINNNDTSSFCFSACMSGTYTIGPAATGTYNFNTFNSAISTLQLAGICGHVVFDVYPGTYAEQVNVPQINGMDINNTVTFRGTGDSTQAILQFTSTTTANWTLRLNGADFFRFEKLTIQALDITYGRVVELTNGAHYNKFSNCQILSAGASSSSTALVYDYSTLNHYNQYLNNYMKGGYYGLYIYGISSASWEKGTVIKGNIIRGTYYYPIYVYYGDSVEVIGNLIDSVTGTYSYGISLYYTNNYYRIIGNTVKIIGTSGVSYGIRDYYCNYFSYNPSPTGYGLVANNMVSISGSTTGHYGMYAYYCNGTEYYNNSVHVTGGSATYYSLYQYNTTSNTLGQKFVNNTFSNTVGGYAAYFGTTASVIDCDYNNYYSSSSNMVYWNGVVATIPALQTTSLKNQHSVNLNPPVTGAHDLHLTNTLLSAKATPLAAITVDIDGDPRTSTPTIGADEIPLISKDAGVSSFLLPVSPTNEGQSYPVEVVLTNFGMDTIFSMNVEYTVNNGTPVGAVFNDTILTMDTAHFVMPNFTSPAGNYTICAKTLLTGDTNYFNDQTCKTLFGTPVHDAKSVAIAGLVNGCNIGLDTVSVWVKNLGVDTINSPLPSTITMHYRTKPTNPVVNQPLTQVIAPGDSVLFVFTTLGDFTSTVANDTFHIEAWVNLQGDNVEYNDTAKLTLISFLVPPAPTVTNVTSPYASPATLTASSSTNSPILWYTVPTGGTAVHTGTSYTTPLLYTNTTYYVESSTLTQVAGSFLSPNGFTGGTSCGGGFMIDVTALTSDITITALDMNLLTTGPQTVAFFYRVGTWVGNAANQAAWIPWGTYSVNCPGANMATNMPITPLTIPQGATYAIYWQANSAYASISTNTTYSNGDISVLSGMAHCTAWDGCCSPRGWNGRIYYTKGGFGCASARVPLVVTVTAAAAADVGVSDIIAPTTGVNLTPNETVTVKVKNYGTAAQSNIPVSFKVDANTAVTETIPGPIGVGDSLTYIFVAKANLGIAGTTYQIKAWTSLTGDITYLNDTAWKTVQNLIPNYCPSNATSNGYEELTNVTLHTLNNTSAAANAMYTNFTATVPPPVLSPGISYPLSITSAISPGYSSSYSCWVKVFMDLNRDGTLDGVTEMMYSSATTSANTVTGNITIPPTALSGNTMMRVVFVETSTAASVTPCGTYTWGETEDYMITISPQGACDAGVTLIVEPTGTTTAGAVLPIKVQVMNFGSNPIATGALSISLTVNGGTPQIIPYTGTLALPSMGVDTAVILPSFTALMGYNTICVKTILACDTISFNDEKCVNVFGVFSTTVPFFDDFEGQNLWYKPDNAVNWQYGTPASTIINSAYSGTKAWKTKLASNYSDNANEYLYSPIFDFSGLGATDTITLSFYHWMDVQASDYGRVQYSIDGGVNWANLGFSGDPLGTNWYNTQSGGVHYFSLPNTGWQYSAYQLVPATFNIHTDVRFRFNFYSNTSGNANGWAIDNFKLALPLVANDVGISMINYPVIDTAMGSVVNPTVTINNYGTNTQVMIPVVLKVNGNVVATEVWSGSLAPQSNTTYTFIQSFTVPSTAYTFCAETQLVGDPHPSNDGSCRNFTPLPAYHDVGAVVILEPLPDSIGQICFYEATTHKWYQYTVKVRLQNFGQNAQTSIPLKYTFFNGGPLQTETWTGNLAPGTTVDVDLTNKFLPNLGAQQLCVETNLTGDLVTTNNKACKSYIGVTCIGIDDPNANGFVVGQNIPNPANNQTLIPYVIPEAGEVTLIITDLPGQVMFSEVQARPAGEHQFEMNVSQLASGVYYYTLEYRGQRVTRKLIVNQ